MQYRLECESRAVNAIGMMESHIDYIEAESPNDAREKYRASFDYSKRDHLLIKTVKEI